MNDPGLTKRMQPTTYGWMMAVLPMLAPVTLGACVNVTAPDKPIEINLNISVTQEVVYRLDNSAKEFIKDNPGIF